MSRYSAFQPKHAIFYYLNTICCRNFDAHLLPMLFFTFSDKKKLGDFVYLKINMESHIFKQELYTVVYHSQIKIT